MRNGGIQSAGHIFDKFDYSPETTKIEHKKDNLIGKVIKAGIDLAKTSIFEANQLGADDNSKVSTAYRQ